jgi:acyl carrier protein
MHAFSDPAAPAMHDTVVALIARIRNDPGLAARLSPDTGLLDEVGLNSIEVVELMLGLEDALDVEIPFGTLKREDLASVRTLVAAVRGEAA